MVSNHRPPNSQGIELVDRANNIDVTSQRLPDELDPTGGDAICHEYEMRSFPDFLLQNLYITLQLVHLPVTLRLTEYRNFREGSVPRIPRKRLGIAPWRRRTAPRKGTINLSGPSFPSWMSSSRTFET